jgi:hypothetical protein
MDALDRNITDPDERQFMIKTARLESGYNPTI